VRASEKSKENKNDSRTREAKRVVLMVFATQTDGSVGLDGSGKPFNRNQWNDIIVVLHV
jgi:hypothetical protein